MPVFEYAYTFCFVAAVVLALFAWLFCFPPLRLKLLYVCLGFSATGFVLSFLNYIYLAVGD